MVVESHDLDVARDASTGFAEHGESAEGLAVRAAQDAVEVGMLCEEFTRGRSSAARRIGRVDDLERGCAESRELPLDAIVSALRSVGSRDDCDAAGTAFTQVARAELAALPVIDRDGPRVLAPLDEGAEHDRGDLGAHCFEQRIVDVGREHECAVDPVRGKLTNCAFALLVGGGEKQVEGNVGPHERGVDALEHPPEGGVLEQLAVGLGEDRRVHVTFARGEGARVRVGAIPGFSDGLFDLGAGSGGGDLAVEHT